MNVMKLDGELLDYWVAKSENRKLLDAAPVSGVAELLAEGHWHPAIFHPSRDWSQGGPIIAADWYDIEDALHDWFGAAWPHIGQIAEQPLTWLLRAFVKSKFGDEVEDVAAIANSRPIQRPMSEQAAPAEAASGGGWFARFSRGLG